FFQAEDGIRDLTVTGVQTCALPILGRRRAARIAQRKQIRAISAGAGFSRPFLLKPAPAPRKTPGRRRAASMAGWMAETSARSVQIGRASCRERGENRGRDDRRKVKR